MVFDEVSGTAVWYAPSGRFEDVAVGLYRVACDVEEVCPKLRGRWNCSDSGELSEEGIASTISWTRVSGISHADGSPVMVQGGMVEAWRDTDSSVLGPEDLLASMIFSRDLETAEKQQVDFKVFGVGPGVLSVLVRSMVRHLRPDHVWGVDDDGFVDDLMGHETANKKWTPLVGAVSWVRGLSGDVVVGYPVRGVEEYEGGLYFEAVSDRAGVVLAGLADHLEHLRVREGFGLDRSGYPESDERYQWDPPVRGNPVFQSVVAGVEIPGDGSPLPVYRVAGGPWGEDVEFHGHLWRGNDEVFVTALGGFPDGMTDYVIQGWGELARCQVGVLPEAAVNEWYLDNQSLVDRLTQYFTKEHIPTTIHYHPAG